MKTSHVIALIVAVAAGGVWLWSASQETERPNAIPAADEVKITAGKAGFEAHCAVCHGPGATGTDQGPPLVHKIYEPSHHADIAFQMAVKNGARAHHWEFGNMPPVPAVSDGEVAEITSYVRSLQREAGIF